MRVNLTDPAGGERVLFTHSGRRPESTLSDVSSPSQMLTSDRTHEHDPRNSGNERAKRRYLQHLKETKGRAIAATVSDPSVFRSGREFAAWLAMMPRQNSTGALSLPLHPRNPAGLAGRMRCTNGPDTCLHPTKVAKTILKRPAGGGRPHMTYAPRL